MFDWAAVERKDSFSSRDISDPVACLIRVAEISSFLVVHLSQSKYNLFQSYNVYVFMSRALQFSRDNQSKLHALKLARLPKYFNASIKLQ
jgi:hypothetical protein